MSRNIKVGKKRNSAEINSIKAIIISLLVGMLAFISLLAFFSVLLLNIMVDKNSLFIFVLVSSGISSFCCAISGCRFFAQKRLIFSMASTIILSIIEFLLILCFNNTFLSNFVYLLFPVVVLFGFVGCVIGTNIKKK